jgi:hypothetical protein
MEELRRLAAEYYRNTVSIRFFGAKGGAYLLISAPFIVLSFYLNQTLKVNFISIIPAFIGASIWSKARTEYNKNLITRLQFHTHSHSILIREQKALYLQSITAHIGLSLYDTMKAFRDVVETDNQNRSFVLDNGWYHFFRFLYNSEAKNRILSLVIYLISLIAIITVVKPELNYNIYELISELTFEKSLDFFMLSSFLILLGYVLIVVPLMFFVTYLIVPIMIRLSSHAFLSRFFISELNRYAFIEQR